jgi:putative hydrolase of the HAD superfamily
MKPYRAVLFDFFGTLVPNFKLSEHKALLREMAATVGAPAEPFVERWLATFEERATGVFPTARENIFAVCKTLNVTPTEQPCAEAVRLRLAFEQRHITHEPTALAVLDRLRSYYALKTCVISDCSPELPQIWKETPFAPLFDAAVFSCEAGVRKPNPKIYLEACRRLGVEPDECLFVGDGGSGELTGAAAVGMHAVLLARPAERNNADTHRIDAEEWQGRTIHGLKEVLILAARRLNPAGGINKWRLNSRK